MSDGTDATDDRPHPPAALPDMQVVEAQVLGEPCFTPAQIWELAAVDEGLARSLWLAMGFPRTPDDEASLTRMDLDALRRARSLLGSGAFDAAQLVTQTRIMGQAMSTIATAHVETLGLDRAGPGFLRGLIEPGDPPAGGGPGGPAATLLPVLDALLPYLYRRHLVAALERAALAGEASGAPLPVTVVGFADLTDFSATAARATEEELTGLVDDFASLAADLVAAAGGRVVKLIGDEVMFSVDDPHRAAELALALAEAVRDPGLPPVHVGLARGPVLSHHGDLFGSTVNLASRLSDVAHPGAVLVNAGLAEALQAAPAGEGGSDPGEGAFTVRRAHLRALKGFGHVPAYALRRSG